MTMLPPPDSNPYAPPTADTSPFQVSAASHAPQERLFSVTAITLAGFLGAVSSATALIAVNYWRQQRLLAAGIVAGVGFVTIVVNFLAALWLPEDGPTWPFWLVHTLLSYGLAVTLQQQPVLEHVARGGRLSSIWWAVGISILISIAQVVLYLVVVEVVPERYLTGE